MTDRFIISGNSYSELMNNKTRQYNNLIRKAEVVNRDNGGRATKEEGRLYREAAAVCAEIVNLNQSNRDTVERWLLLKKNCEAEVDRIVNEIAPYIPPAEPPVSPAPAAEEKKSVPSPSGKETKAAAADSNGVAVTSSGFSTKNASRDVPAETIEKWYKAKPNHLLRNVIGMDEQKTILCEQAGNLEWKRTDSALGISPLHSFFFYGPPGCGKSFLIEAFAADMMEKGFRFIQLMGGEIHASLVGVAEKTVQTAFAEAIDNEPCVLYIDEIDNVCVNRDNPRVEGHEKRLTVAFLEAYNMLKNAGKRVIFIGATNHPELVDEAMLDRITLVRVPLPAQEVRLSYFEKHFNKVRPEEGFSCEEMADATDNYSFRDLDHLKDAIMEKLRLQTTKAYQVLDENGEVDKKATDDAAADAIDGGKVFLTKELFNETRTMIRPSSKVSIRAALEQFESRMTSGEV